MTDNEIIKALKLCTSEHMGCEDGCPYRLGECLDDGYRSKPMKDALDLINRQKAEIERLKNAYKQCARERDTFLEELKTEKTEAYKEFAERLHQKCAIDRGFAVMPDDAIEITLKELTESN